jgi:hypothetical protein
VQPTADSLETLGALLERALTGAGQLAPVVVDHCELTEEQLRGRYGAAYRDLYSAIEAGTLNPHSDNAPARALATLESQRDRWESASALRGSTGSHTERGRDRRDQLVNPAPMQREFRSGYRALSHGPGPGTDVAEYRLGNVGAAPGDQRGWSGYTAYLIGVVGAELRAERHRARYGSRRRVVVRTAGYRSAGGTYHVISDTRRIARR